MKATGRLAKTDRIDTILALSPSAAEHPTLPVRRRAGASTPRHPCSACPYSPKYLEEETRFSVAGGVRPVGGIQGRLVQVVIRKLDQQRMAPRVAGQEAQPPHVLRPGRGGRLEEPVPDGVRPRPREVLDRTLQQR